MSAGLADVRIAHAARGMRTAIPALAIGTCLLLLLFWPECRAAVGVWLSSTAFGHCFLVLPIAGWLAWERRVAIMQTPIAPLPWAALAAIPLAGVWLAAERLGVMEGRQLAAMAQLQLLALTVLGWRAYRAASVPLLYLFFLVPFGAFLVPALQTFTTQFIDVGLTLLRVPHAVDATIIEIPEGAFRVAEACAGLRFLIASIAFGVLYACIIYRSAWRRIVFIGVSVVVPIVANGLRALGIVELGHLLGSAQAVEVDHVLYGWIFFSIVILLLILAGLPFREDAVLPMPRPLMGPPLPTPARHSVFAAGLAVLLLAASGPATAGLLDRRAEREQAVLRPVFAVKLLAAFRAAPGCVEQAAVVAGRRFQCGGTLIDVRVQEFSDHASAAVLWAAQRLATREETVDDPEISSLAHWRLVATGGALGQLTATMLWIDGQPGLEGLRARLRQARASVFGSDFPPLLVVVSVIGTSGADREALRRFLDSQTGLLASVPGSASTLR